MRPEQRARFETYCASQNVKERQHPLLIKCMACDQIVFDLKAPAEFATGAVVVPYFGNFCSQACAKAFEHDYGILFKRNATGQISYE